MRRREASASALRHRRADTRRFPGLTRFAATAGLMRFAAAGLMRTYSTGFTAEVDSTATTSIAGTIIDGMRVILVTTGSLPR